MLFESDLAELILAQAFHCHRLAMAAQLAEAGAPPPHEATELSSHQSQSMALIRFARLHGYTAHSPGGASGTASHPPLPPGAFGSS